MAKMLNFMVISLALLLKCLFDGIIRANTRTSSREERKMKMKIADIIKMRRKELGMTLEEVGQIVGVDKTTVRRWEAGGIANMRRDRIAKLAEALQIEPTDLIGEDDTGDPVRNYTNIWAREVVKAYKAAPEHIRVAMCAMLQVPPLNLPEQEEKEER